MSEDPRKQKIDAALAAWISVPAKYRRALVQELGNMAIESAEEESHFSVACNRAANLLHSISELNPSDRT